MLSYENAFSILKKSADESHTRIVFIGAIAAISWSRLRTTTDVDLVTVNSVEAFEKFGVLLTQSGFTKGAPVGEVDGLPDISVFWSPGLPSIRIDLFHAKTPFEIEVMATARPSNFLGFDILVASRESVIVYKLLASRFKDLADLDAIANSIKESAADVDWAYVEKWCQFWGIEVALQNYRERTGI